MNAALSDAKARVAALALEAGRLRQAADTARERELEAKSQLKAQSDIVAELRAMADEVRCGLRAERV